MVLCDSNVWLALALSKHSRHVAAREWLETVDDHPATDAAFRQFRGLDLLVLG